MPFVEVLFVVEVSQTESDNINNSLSEAFLQESEQAYLNKVLEWFEWFRHNGRLMDPEIVNIIPDEEDGT